MSPEGNVATGTVPLVTYTKKGGNMSEYTIQNENLQLTISSKGAEMKSLIRKRDGQELLWQADPAFWGRTSPVLFPVVGCYNNGISVYEGREYKMSQHGFARDAEFTFESQTENEIWFSLSDSEVTHEKYPFAFLLTIGYVLQDDSVEVIWKVKNTDSKRIFFSIGGHPAFNCNLNESKLQFTKNEKIVAEPLTCNIIEGDGSGCLSNRLKQLNLSAGILSMSDELFAEDALIIEDRQADAVTLIDEAGASVLKVSFDSPLFGIWSPVGKHAPFVCIEPWYGRCDRRDFTGDLTEREYGNRLEVGEEFCAKYKVEVI